MILRTNGMGFSFLDLPVADILPNPKRDWEKISRPRNMRVARAINADWDKYNPNDYLFSHVSIVASVATEANGYHIADPCHELVNSNGNAWTNAVLPHCFKTFAGAYNFREHNQIPELSYGRILDTVLRPVMYTGKNGKTQQVWYCDLLVATSRRFPDLCARIENGELRSMSMGCLIQVSQCSYCGKLIYEGQPNCEHLEEYTKMFMLDENGVHRIIAELCGAMDRNGRYIPNSCVFIEASWVEHPAFKGAEVNEIVKHPNFRTVTNASESKKQPVIENPYQTLWFDPDMLTKLRVADTNGAMAIKLAIEELRRQRYGNMAGRIMRANLP